MKIAQGEDTAGDEGGGESPNGKLDDELNKKLGTNSGEKKRTEIGGRAIDWRRICSRLSWVMKDRVANVVASESMQSRWRKYFKELINEIRKEDGGGGGNWEIVVRPD